MGFAINISHTQYRHHTATCENRNMLMWFRYVLTALHVNCMIMLDRGLYGAFPVTFNECIYQLLNEYLPTGI